MGSNYTPLFSGGYKSHEFLWGKDARHAATLMSKTPYGQ